MSRLPTRDPQQGDVVYLKYRDHNIPLAVEILGRVMATTGHAKEGQASVRWHNGETTCHPLRDLVSVTKKLAIALHDAERFARLIREMEAGEGTSHEQIRNGSHHRSVPPDGRRRSDGERQGTHSHH